MNLHLRLAFTLFLWICLTAATGCTSHTGGRLYESQPWVQRGGSLGKVSLIITGGMYDPAQDENQALKPLTPDKVAGAIRAALANLPDTAVQDDITTFPGTTAMGDREAIALARSRGAQSVCLVSIADIGGRITIGFLPPLVPAWSCESHALYTIRLLDVASGDLLASALTHRIQGGTYSFCDWEDCYKGFAVDLRAPRAVQAPRAVARSAP